MAESSVDALIELFARDVDRDLIRRGLAKTPTERIQWLEDMQAFSDAATVARADEAKRSPR